MDILLFVHVILCIALIGLVLLQQGKGASMGAAFGSGASGSVFGSRGPAGFLMKLTAFIVTAFFATSLLLGYIAARGAHQNNLIQSAPPVQSTPVAPVQSAPVSHGASLPHHAGQPR